MAPGTTFPSPAFFALRRRLLLELPPRELALAPEDSGAAAGDARAGEANERVQEERGGEDCEHAEQYEDARADADAIATIKFGHVGERGRGTDWGDPRC